MKYRLIKNFLLLILVIISISCLTLRNAPNKSEFGDSYQYCGAFDSSSVFEGRFIQPKYTIVYTDSGYVIPIWGKRCEFKKGEEVYSYGEWWHSVGYCKYFLVNSDRTLKYSIK